MPRSANLYLSAAKGSVDKRRKIRQNTPNQNQARLASCGYERNVGTNQNPIDVTTKYYTATLGKVGRLIAFRKGGTLFYVGTDHLGGTIWVADANFVPLDQMRYFSYGASRDAGSNLNTDHLFTSQIQDAAIG